MSARLFALYALVAVTPVAAQTPASPPPPAQEPAKPPKTKLICKTYAETGSLIARNRVCKTAAEWRQDADDLQNFNSNRICTGSASCSGGVG